MSKKLLTIKELAKQTGISPRTLYQWVFYGKIKPIAPGHCLFKESIIEVIKSLKKNRKGRRSPNGIKEGEIEKNENSIQR